MDACDVELRLEVKSVTESDAGALTWKGRALLL